MKIRFTRRAAADLDNVFAYVANENPRAAADLVGQITAAIRRLARFPDLGHATKPAGRQVMTVAKTRYRVFYRIREDEVRILTIRHTSRRPLRNAP
jgi:addiction module RelE/StbE family toxin